MAKSQRLAVVSNADESHFVTDIYKQRIPIVLRNLDIGQCTEKWSWDYLAKVCGNTKVKVHVSGSGQMDFMRKNFIYSTLSFADFLHRVPNEKQSSFIISEDEKYYLRSLGDDPRKDVADIRKQFPELIDDIRFPHLYDADKFFSSVFRIASKGVQLWTHYDVMDNMLIVVSGSKRVVLYRPCDADNLYLVGDKSEVIDIDNVDVNKYPLFNKAVRYECVLEPGDILFIPAFWFHNVINTECGISVNVFWRHLQPEMYNTSDVYGNKDLVDGSRALQAADRVVKILRTLPDVYRDFYARRVISKIRTDCCRGDDCSRCTINDGDQLSSNCCTNDRYDS